LPGRRAKDGSVRSISRRPGSRLLGSACPCSDTSSPVGQQPAAQRAVLGAQQGEQKGVGQRGQEQPFEAPLPRPSHVHSRGLSMATSLLPYRQLRSICQGGIMRRAVKRVRGTESHSKLATPGIVQSPIARGQRKSGQTRPVRWARAYDACIDCGTMERPHRAHGRCKRCDDRWRYRGAH